MIMPKLNNKAMTNALTRLMFTLLIFKVTNASTNFQKKVMTLSNQSPNTRYAEISTNIQILDALKKFLGAKK